MTKKKLNKLTPVKSTPIKLIERVINDYGISSDKQLIDLAKQLKIKLNYVGFIENLQEIKKDGGYIFNLGDTKRFGTHWTALYKEKDKAFYFDSFAAPPEDKITNLETNIKDLIYNDYAQVQGIEETLCGIWAILFLYHMQNSKEKKLIDKFKEFIKKYKDLDGDYSSGQLLKF